MHFLGLRIHYASQERIGVIFLAARAASFYDGGEESEERFLPALGMMVVSSAEMTVFFFGRNGSNNDSFRVRMRLEFLPTRMER